MEGVGACYTIHATCHVKERGLSRLGFGRDRGLSNRRRKRTSSSRPYIYRKKKKKKRPLPSRGRIKRRALEVGGGLAAIVLPLPRRAAAPPLPSQRTAWQQVQTPSFSLPLPFDFPATADSWNPDHPSLTQLHTTYILTSQKRGGKIWSTELKS